MEWLTTTTIKTNFNRLESEQWRRRQPKEKQDFNLFFFSSVCECTLYTSKTENLDYEISILSEKSVAEYRK